MVKMLTNVRKTNSMFYGVYRTVYHVLFKRHFYGLTSSFRVLPDLIVIGVVRGGTTSLYHYLAQHPCIRKSAYDEIGFFDDNYHLGLNWYRSMFPTRFTKQSIEKKHGKFITYEVTPFYIYSKKVASRIQSILPHVKLITILRNPIDRAYSNYHLSVRMGNEKRTFEEAIEKDFETLKEIEPFKNSKPEYYQQIAGESYIARGFYAEQLKTWLELFHKDQILIITTEELGSDSQRTFDFLGLPKHKVKDLEKKNEASYSPMMEKTRKILVDYFKPHNQQLYDLLGIKFDWDH